MDFYLHFILTSQSISDNEFAESDAFRYESDVFGRKKISPALDGGVCHLQNEAGYVVVARNVGETVIHIRTVYDDLLIFELRRLK